jgi:iron complex outermembrane receptor protein
MKKLLGTIVMLKLVAISFSQPTKKTIQVKVLDEKTKQPIAGAVIITGNQQLLTNEDGLVVLNVASTNFTVQSLGYATKQQTINRQSNINIVTLKSIALYLQPLEVKAIRAGTKAPFAKTNLFKEEIEKNNLGQDLPMLLNQTPSVFVNSDAGNGVGYTGIHIRGSDGTRINVTLNGIPYNDAESHGSYFVDLPDFASSLNSIQIQRGVGTSSNGTGALGASINLQTNEFNEKAYSNINNSYGSFNTWKNTLKAGTGLINGHFTVDARLSKISSDGFIDRATSNLKSFAFSAAYVDKSSSIRFNIFSGKERTYQAWYGVPDYLLATTRTYNPAGTEKPGTPYANQTDNYQQDHYQLFFNHSFNQNWSFNLSNFLTYGRGYYEEYKANQFYIDYGLPNIVVGSTIIKTTDLIRDRWLDNYFYGQVFSLQYKNKSEDVTIGGGWNRYDGKHFGNIIWAKNGGVADNYQYYNYPALKTDNNIYVKWLHQLNPFWKTFIDVQYRSVYHRMSGFEAVSNLNIARNFHFINPKAGITYTKGNWQAFFSYALGSKEPNRDDFQASLKSQPNAEYLNDFELGAEQKFANGSWGANLYYMLYKDQLVLTGQINDVGSYTRTNVPNSYRLGLELQVNYTFTKWLNVVGNITFSQNKIKAYTEYIDNYDNGLQNAVKHNNTDISFSPNTIGSVVLNFIPTNNLVFALVGKYVSKQFMDNAQTDARALNAFYTQDVKLSWSLKDKIVKQTDIVFQLNNIFNKKYEPNGYTYTYISGGVQATENSYFPMAAINFMLGLNIKL